VAAGRDLLATHSDLLTRPITAHLATVTPEGAPRVSPVWFRWDGNHVMVSHTRRREKYRDIRANPRVALSILDPEDRLRYLELRGVVDEIRNDADLDFYRALREHYGAEHPLRHPRDRVVLYIRPVEWHGR